MQRYRGFTILELVLVIIVILVLVAVLFPVFMPTDGYARRRAVCQSNMKQIGLGFIQYVQDYDERFPAGQDWASAIYPYEKSTGVFHCPKDPNAATATTYPNSYAMNANIARRSLTGFNSVSVTVLAGEFTSASGNMTVPNDLASSRTDNGLESGVAVWGNAKLGETATAPTIHDPAIMFLASDGHVKQLRPEKVSGGVNAASSMKPVRATPNAAAGTGMLGTTYTFTYSMR